MTREIDWLTLPGLSPYLSTVAAMQECAANIAAGIRHPCIWLLEHPPLYTIGTSGKLQDIHNRNLPYYETGRGGQATYHGPGQRVVYVILDLNDYNRDIRGYIQRLQQWIMVTLQAVGVDSWTHPDRIGIWVKDNSGHEAKIAAVGVRVHKWISLHGFAININPDLENFKGIVPCGLSNYGVTSLNQLGVFTSLTNIDKILHDNFSQFF